MKETKKTYVGAAVFFDRLADDGWSEDVGLWPIGGRTLPPAKCFHKRLQGVSRLSQFIKSLLRDRDKP